MKTVILCDAKFGAGAIQAAIDFLTVERRYQVVGAAVIAPKVVADFGLEVPAVTAPDATVAVREAARVFQPAIIFDVTESDVASRLSWLDEALRLGMEVHGPDFRFWPPAVKSLPGVASAAFVGAAPRVGKTAAILTFLKNAVPSGNPVALVMAAGGPTYPELIEPMPRKEVGERLLSFHRAGRRIAGDHYLIAGVSGFPAIGCSYAGAGVAGVGFSGGIGDGIILASEVGGNILIIEGAGNTAPPVAASASCFVTSLNVSPALLTSLPASYHLSRADLVIVTGLEPQPASADVNALRAALKTARCGAPVRYGQSQFLPAEKVGAADAVVVTARDATDREGVEEYWRSRFKLNVLDVVCRREEGGQARALKRRGDFVLLLDLTVPGIGAWLEEAARKRLQVVPTYEELDLEADAFEPLTKRLLEAP